MVLYSVLILFSSFSTMEADFLNSQAHLLLPCDLFLCWLYTTDFPRQVEESLFPNLG